MPTSGRDADIRQPFALIASIISRLVIGCLVSPRTFAAADSAPSFLSLAGLALFLVIAFAAGCALFLWSMAVNPFFSSIARIQAERGHRLITTGPYRVIRHPGYAAAVLANPEVETDEDLTKARIRFRELYVAELSMVECPNVEASMIQLAQTIDKDLTTLTPAQSAAYKLAHALRDTFVMSWEVEGTCPQ